jgi:flavodoxin
VIYESMYGNTEQIGKAVGDGNGELMPVDVIEVGIPPTALAADIGLVVVGGPTHGLGMSRPATREDAAKQVQSPLVSSGIGVRDGSAH